ncbi:MAG TPA: hypothetical protein V6D31_08675, partial [Candidatus Sericytochromatia bacterium]
MSKVLWKSLLITPVALAATVAVSASTIAAETQARTEVAQADAPTEFSQVRAIFSANYRQTSTPKAEVPANRLPDPIVVATVEPAVESLALRS